MCKYIKTLLALTPLLFVMVTRAVAQECDGLEGASPEELKRKAAILALCAELSSERNYIQQTCRELQRQRIPLLADWVKDWNRDHKLGLQNWDWFVAYDSGKRTVRDRTQHYISAICKPTGTLLCGKSIIG